MEIYIVIIGNYITDERDTCGAFSTLDLAKRQMAPSGWFIDHFELWRLNGECIDPYIAPEKEDRG